MDSKGIIRKRLAQHRDIIEQILADEKLQDTIAQITDTIVTCFKYGGRVYFCGNGGSAADAQHLAAEFSGKFYLERDIVPSTDTPRIQEAHITIGHIICELVEEEIFGKE